MRGAPSRLFCLALLAGLTIDTVGAQAAELLVTVTGVRSTRGVVRLCIFTTPRDFPDCTNTPDVRKAVAPARPGSVRLKFTGLAPGTYAVSAYHDESNIGRLRKNLFGIPEDGVGVSNNPRGLLGPPSFGQAAFRLPPAGGQIVISLVYP